MLQQLFVRIIAALAIKTTAIRSNFRSQFDNEDFEEKLGLIQPRTLIESHATIANVFNDEVGANNTCGRDLGILQDALTRRETWAMKMLDASSKIPSGIFEGNLIDLGMFDECVSIQGESQGIEIRGHHCMYTITMAPVNNTPSIKPTLSICMPSTCNGTDVVDLLNNTINAINNIQNLGITVDSATCTPIDKVIWNAEFTICFSIILVFIGFLLFCTIIDLILRRSDAEGVRHSLLSSLAKFSLIKSASAILNTHVQEGNLPAIHGIRFLSMCWVVLGHEYALRLLGANVNNLSAFNWLSSWRSLYIFTAPFSVDTFFTISGFLMAYLFLKQMPKRKSFNVPLYYLHRYFRLTPSVIALFVLMVVFAPHVGSGPRWDQMLYIYGESCRDKWWPHIIYIQNFIDKENMCLGHLWYLAVDMQLFWISPLILYPLYKKPKWGLIILSAFFLASIATPGIIVGINKYPAFSFVDPKNLEEASEVFGNVYEMPYNRAGPWLLGIMLGFEVANNNRRLGKYAVFTGWSITIGAFLFCICGTRTFMEPDYKYDVIWETTFTAICRPIWGVGICWVIYACLHNHAGLVSSFLCCKIFIPLSRISYCVYLVHFVVQILVESASRIPYFFSDYFIWRDFITDLILSIVVGFFFSLLFESPFMVLDKMIFRRNQENVKDSRKNLRLESSKDQQA